MSVQFGLFRSEPLPVAGPKPPERWTPPPHPVLSGRALAFSLEHHTACDSTALRATWGPPDCHVPADRLSDARVAELLALFERQLGRRP